MIFPKSEPPSASEQPSVVVRCITQLERRYCPGASGSMQARRHYPTVFFLPMFVVNLDREHSCCGGDRADRADGDHRTTAVTVTARFSSSTRSHLPTCSRWVFEVRDAVGGQNILRFGSVLDHLPDRYAPGVCAVFHPVPQSCQNHCFSSRLQTFFPAEDGSFRLIYVMWLSP